MLIKAENISKVYGSGASQVTALHRANLEIASGEFLSIMGPSGSGKSTLLHLLSGLDYPTAGSLSYDGQEIYKLRDRELSAFRRRRIGFIFQQFHLLPVLTARENILMPLLLDKKQADSAYFDELTELLGIRDRLAHLPHELSGGQQQRVAIARALIAKPDIIFADEPTGNLDSKSGAEVMRMLKNIWEKMGRTLVVITHDHRIAQMAARKVVIVDGVLSEGEQKGAEAL
ncbi:MAG: ABC transporter ATP-binding protein [Lachnospiraceae bacterium]|jgi:putative ABC transport system ATP-binding protein|nr:ABC transporter ATP-binding protein [Lachnospiraceae bacterium]MCI8973914.1 ABC transporter ATP-binding protein [Lachnospiraceae bacterium]